MSETKVTRRPRGEDAIYFDTAKNRYVGSVSLGYGVEGKRIRRKVSGKTKQEVRDRLKALHQEMDAGVRSSKTYTVREAVNEWLRDVLDGTSEASQAGHLHLGQAVLLEDRDDVAQIKLGACVEDVLACADPFHDPAHLRDRQNHGALPFPLVARHR